MTKGYSIEKIEIVSFGKLKNVVLTPTNHINMLVLPNEGGKSTLAAFLKYIFYGFNGTKKQSVSENEKLKYMPWDGSAALGAVVVYANEKRYRIERKTLGREEKLEVTDLETGESVFKGQVPGVAIFGINEDTFAKTVFVGRIGDTKNGDATLAESIRNLLFSADEKTNADKALKHLKDGRAYLKNMQYRGVIPSLEEKCKRLEASLSDANAIASELTGARVSLCSKRETLETANGELAEITKEIENITCFEAKKKLEAIEKAKRELKNASVRYDEMREILGGDNTPETRLIDALADDNAHLSLSGERLKAISSELEKEEKALNEIKNSSPFFKCDPYKAKKTAKIQKTLMSLLLPLGAVLLLGAVTACFLKNNATTYAVSAVVCVLYAVLLLFLRVKSNRFAGSYGFSSVEKLISAAEEFPIIREKANEAGCRVASLEQRYTNEVNENRRLADSVERRVKEYMPKSDNSDGYSASIRKIYSASSQMGQCKAELIRAEGVYNSLTENEDIDELKEKALRAVTPAKTRDEAERELKFTQSRLNALHLAVTELEKKCAALEAQSESPAIISSKLVFAEKQLDEANAQYRALSLAIDVLEESCNYMKSTVAPKLAELTGGYLDIASGGKYTSVDLNANLEMTVSDGGMDHSADYFSDGTRDSAYLAMRFALVELLFDDVRPFVVLDDSFCHLDDKRLERMLHLISGLAEEQQIFIFSCRERERNMLEVKDVHYNTLEIGELK